VRSVKGWLENCSIKVDRRWIKTLEEMIPYLKQCDKNLDQVPEWSPRNSGKSWTNGIIESSLKEINGQFGMKSL